MLDAYCPYIVGDIYTKHEMSASTPGTGSKDSAQQKGSMSARPPSLYVALRAHCLGVAQGS